MCRTTGTRRSAAVVEDTRSRPLRPAVIVSVVARRPSSSVTLSDGPAGSTSIGGSSTSPCEWIVRARSTGSPPAPTSGISVLHATASGVDVLGVTRQPVVRQHVPGGPRVDVHVRLRTDLGIVVERAHPDRHLVAVGPRSAEEARAALAAKRLHLA